VPSIATPLQNICRVSVANLTYLHDLQLAHPITSEREFNISLLIGADHYWDRDFTTFFWLTDLADPSSKFCVYRFKVVPFGATSSPFMLNATLQYHLESHNSVVSQDMLNNLYVDNIITSCPTEQEAVQYYKEARSIMSQANFNLRSWSSNSTMLTAIATQEKTSDGGNSVNILGICWNTTTDEIMLATKSLLLTSDILITKRDS